MLVQITTEAVGKYSPDQQRELVERLIPSMISFSIREMLAGDQVDQAKAFYHWADDQGISVQHILYDEADIITLSRCIDQGTIPPERIQVLYVLGRYAANMESNPEDLNAYLDATRNAGLMQDELDWAVCAFGMAETQCLTQALRQGGKVRVGFENSLYNRDGSLAADNRERFWK